MLCAEGIIYVVCVWADGWWVVTAAVTQLTLGAHVFTPDPCFAPKGALRIHRVKPRDEYQGIPRNDLPI